MPYRKKFSNSEWADLVFGKECIANAGQQHHRYKEGYEEFAVHGGGEPGEALWNTEKVGDSCEYSQRRRKGCYRPAALMRRMIKASNRAQRESQMAVVMPVLSDCC